MRRIAVLITLALSSAVTFAQSATAPSGHWEGTIQIPAQELKVEVDLAGGGETWEGTISVPAQGLKAFPLSAISVQANSVSFAMKGIPGTPTFRGTVAADGKTMSGDFSQGGATFPFALTRTGDATIEPAAKSTPITKDMEGSWNAALDAEGRVLRLLLKLSNGPDGAGTGTIVSVDQGGTEVPIATVMQTGTHITLLLPTIAATYEGDLNEEQLAGKWTQGPRTWPLVFSRPK